MTVQEALDKLKEHGYKYTGKREEMIRVFAKEKRYLSAKDLLDKLQDQFPGLSFDTIYRNLALFEELDIIESTQLNDERIYRLACSPQEHHHHLICTTCGRTKRIDICPMESIEAEADQFTITGHKFEIYGTCAECKGGV